MQLQQFKEVHYLVTGTADFKLAIIIAGSFQSRQKYSKSGTVNESDAFQVEYQVHIWLQEIFKEFLLYWFSNRSVKPVGIFKAYNQDI